VSTLFNRDVSLQVADLRLDGFDLSFHIARSLSAKTPNTAEIKVWNLNADHRKRLQEAESVYVSLEAGYVDATSLLFRGDLRDASSTREGADWITAITSDAGRRARKARIVKSFAPGASVSQVLQDAAKQMGLKLGNSAQRVVEAKIAGTAATQYFNGYALAGSVEDEIDRIASSCNLEWSVQDDELQFLDYGEPLSQLAVKLTPDTGLVGSPEPGNKGLVDVRCLIIPDLYPGRRVEVQSEHVKGFYRIEVSKHTGQTFGKDWYVDLQLKSEQRKASS
jgi:hypothetical protein